MLFNVLSIQALRKPENESQYKQGARPSFWDFPRYIYYEPLLIWTNRQLAKELPMAHPLDAASTGLTFL